MHLYFHEIYKKPFLEKIAIKMLAKVAAVWIETATQLDEILKRVNFALILMVFCSWNYF